MRAFTTLFIAAAITLSASAIEADMSKGFAECNEVTKKMSTELTALTNLLVSYQGPATDAKQKRDMDAPPPTDTEIKILEQYGEFFYSLDSANEKCCSGVPSADDVKSILDTMSKLVPEISIAMEDLKSKKPQLSGLSLQFAEYVLEEVDYPTKNLQKCLVDAAPEADKVKGQEYADSVLKSLKEAQDLYKITVSPSTPADTTSPTVAPVAPSASPAPSPASPAA